MMLNIDNFTFFLHFWLNLFQSNGIGLWCQDFIYLNNNFSNLLMCEQIKTNKFFDEIKACVLVSKKCKYPLSHYCQFSKNQYLLVFTILRYGKDLFSQAKQN